MIDVRNITKRYYALVAVDNVSFTIPQGEVLGILGPNGAGKTTLFKMIAGLLRPDSGDIAPSGGAWPTISLKPERLLFPDHLRVRGYLEMVARLTDLPGRRVKTAVNDSLARVTLAEAADKRISECSKGMRQRLALAQALLARPALLLLDEPSNGLDPEGQDQVCRIVEGLRAAGHTILLSSHQLPEVTRICTQLIILNRGQIHYQSSMADALALKPNVTIRASKDLTALQPLLESMHPRLQVDGNEVTLYETASDVRRHVLSIILSAGYDVVHVEQQRATLEEIYAKATQWSDASSP